MTAKAYNTAREGDTVHYTRCTADKRHDRIYTRNPGDCCRVAWSVRLGVGGALPPAPPRNVRAA